MILWWLKRIFSSGFERNVFFSNNNNRSLELALAIDGYGNHADLVASGELYFFGNILRGDDVKLSTDIFSNLDCYTSFLCEETSAQVIRFELQPDVYNKLKSNLSRYSDRCSVINSGLGAKVRRLYINFDDKKRQVCVLRDDFEMLGYLKNTSTTFGRCYHLGSFFEENSPKDVDLIKIDAEGCEAEVFEGGLRVSSENKPKFFQVEMN